MCGYTLVLDQIAMPSFKTLLYTRRPGNTSCQIKENRLGFMWLEADENARMVMLKWLLQDSTFCHKVKHVGVYRELK